jgi:hypothetical protein
MITFYWKFLRESRPSTPPDNERLKKTGVGAEFWSFSVNKTRLINTGHLQEYHRVFDRIPSMLEVNQSKEADSLRSASGGEDKRYQ